MEKSPERNAGFKASRSLADCSKVKKCGRGRLIQMTVPNELQHNWLTAIVISGFARPPTAHFRVVFSGSFDRMTWISALL
jgi:hypothetical protein